MSIEFKATNGKIIFSATNGKIQIIAEEQTAMPSIINITNVGNVISWRVVNNDTATATLYTDVDDTGVQSRSSVLSGSYWNFSYDYGAFAPASSIITAYAIASGKTTSPEASEYYEWI